MKIDKTAHPIIYYAFEFDETFKRKIFSRFIDTVQTIINLTNSSEKLKYIFKLKNLNEPDDKIIYEDILNLLKPNSENRELVLKNVIIIIGNRLVQLLKCLTEDEHNGERAKRMLENVLQEQESLSTLINIIFLTDCNIELHYSNGNYDKQETFKTDFAQIKKNYGLDRENHEAGYYFHYLKLAGKKPERTNLLLYFDNNSNAKKPILLSEEHGTYKRRVYYWKWNERKKGNIYFACKSTLSNIDIQQFRKCKGQGDRFTVPGKEG